MSDTMSKFVKSFASSFCIVFLLSLAACGSASSSAQQQATVTVPPSFQSQTTPIPTTPPYLCGAWTENNAPGAYGTVVIHARLTKNIAGVAGATAVAVVHFEDGDQTLDQQVSDDGGYVTFTLQLQGRQPTGVPATISVTFTGIPGGPRRVDCSQAFFTPQ